MRYWLMIAVVIAGTIFVPTPAYAASDVSSLCPNAHGQNYRPLLPYFNSRTQQVALVDQYSYKVVQVMADNVETAEFFSWSPSCRYFAFATGPYYGSKQTVIWDTVSQTIAGKFQQAINEVAWLGWVDSDNLAIVGTIAGRYLWKLPSNEQIEMTRDLNWWDTRWDTAHQRAYFYDGRYILAYDLNTGKLIRKFISPFNWSSTQFNISPDGATLTIYDPRLDLWSVTWDINAGKIIDAQALGIRTQDDVQFSPNRRFLIIYDYGLNIYDVTVAEKMVTDPCWTSISIGIDKHSWRFVDGNTIEFSYNGKEYQYDMAAKKLSPGGWSPISIQQECFQ